MAKKKMKLVRIDHKTQIEVPENIPDELAKAKFLERQKAYAKSPHADAKRGFRRKNDQIDLDKKDFDKELSD